MKKNSNIDAWVRRAFEKAGEEASAMETVINLINNVLEEKYEDILDAWVEISNTDCVIDICKQAEDNDDFSKTIDNLLRMGVLTGYLAALDDVRNGRLRDLFNRP